VIERLASLLLLAATIVGWFVAGGARPAARLQIRFAGVLLAALGLCGAVLPAAAPAIVVLVLPIALAVLALGATAGLSKPLPMGLSTLLLALASLGGLIAVVTGFAAFAFAPAAVAIAALVLLFARRFDGERLAPVQGVLSALCFLAAVSDFAIEGAGVPLFVAAGLVGLALALSRSDVVVEERPLRDLRRLDPVGGRRQA
jgi:hypothetical protein